MYAELRSCLIENHGVGEFAFGAVCGCLGLFGMWDIRLARPAFSATEFFPGVSFEAFGNVGKNR
jgi:hypothetical protein